MPNEHDLSGVSDEELVQLTIGLGTHAYGPHRERAHIAENELNLRLKRELTALRQSMERSGTRLERLTTVLVWLTVVLGILAAIQILVAVIH
jgi:hypothetical protein